MLKEEEERVRGVECSNVSSFSLSLCVFIFMYT